MPTAVIADRCPGVLRLHEAADGRLARVRVPGGRIAPDALEAIADVAERGNGIIEITSRAGIQIRGLAAGDGGACADRLAAAGLLPSPDHERARNILASPVAGRHPGSTEDVDGVVRELDAALCADPDLATLSGRFLFAVLDGSRTLDARRADVIVRSSDDIPRALAAARAACAGQASADACRTGPSELRSGVLTQRDGRSAITATVPLARLSPGATRSLAALAREHATDVRIAPERTVTFVDVDSSRAPEVLAALSELGLITEPSGWTGLTACAGLGACTKAEADVRALAAARAAVRHANDPPEHWAACARGCGRPPGVALKGAG